MNQPNETSNAGAVQPQPAMANGRPSGIWRDGHRAVVNLRSYAFGETCLVTGERSADAPSELILTAFRWLPLNPKQDEAYRDSIGGIWTVGPFQLVDVKLRAIVPAGMRPGRRRLGEWLFVSGGVLAVVGLIASLIAIVLWEWPAYLLAVPVVVGLATATAGVAMVLRRHVPLVIRRLADGYVWLCGVHPQVLAELPAWQTATEFRHFGLRLARRRLLGGAIAIAVAASLFVVNRDELADARASQNWLETRGQITASRMVEHRPAAKDADRQASFEHQVTYSFLVNDVGFSGTRLRFGKTPSSSSRFEAERRQRQEYAVGRNVTVYHDPVDPRRCSLARAGVWDVWYIAGPIALAMIAGAWLLVTAGLAYRTVRSVAGR
jgi:hypothetical protein